MGEHKASAVGGHQASAVGGHKASAVGGHKASSGGRPQSVGGGKVCGRSQRKPSTKILFLSSLGYMRTRYVLVYIH